MGCGLKIPGTALLAAAARDGEAPAEPVTMQRSPVNASMHVMCSVGAGQRRMPKTRARVRAVESADGVLAARAA